MGSHLSSDGTENSSNTSSRIDNTSANNSEASDQSHVYIKDQFRLEFLDCNCCCDTTKNVLNCDSQGSNILQDLYEIVEAPEYKLNCRCSCGDDNGNTRQSIKFGLTGSPNISFTDDDIPCSTSSDSDVKQ